MSQIVYQFMPSFGTLYYLNFGNFRGVHGERWKKTCEEEFFENISFLQCNYYRKYVEILYKLLLNYP